MTGSDAPRVSRSSGRSAALVGVGVLLSRVSGLLREVVLGAFLGTTKVADAFKAALQIPGFLQNVLGEGVLSASFVPVYSQALEADERDGTDEARDLAATVGAMLGLATAAIVAAGIVLARPIARIFLPRLAPEPFELTVSLMRAMWAGLGFIVMAAWALGVLNAHRKFFLSYLAPVLWNAAQVVMALIAWKRGSDLDDIARAAAWGVAIGGALQFLVQVPSVMRCMPGLRPRLRTDLASVREVWRRFTPAVLGRGVVQVSAFLDLFLAGLLAAGAIQGISIAQILYLLPIGVFAMSIVAADLPELSRDQNRAPRIAARMRTGQDRIAFFVVFSAVAFVTAGKPVVGALFERREFTSEDTVFVWLVLAAYSLGLAASAMSRLLQNACFAQGDVAGPARLAAIRVALAAAVGVALMVQFERLGVVGTSVERLGDLPAFGLLPEAIRDDDGAPQRLGAVGLAVGSAVAAWVEYGLLRRRVDRSLRTTRPLGRPIGALWIPALVSGMVAAGLAWLTDPLHPMLGATVSVGLSGLTYVLIAYRQGSRAAGELLRTARLVQA